MSVSLFLFLFYHDDEEGRGDVGGSAEESTGLVLTVVITRT